MSNRVHTSLRRIYYDPGHVAGYSNANVLYKSVKHLDITREQVERWLKKQDVYTLHRQARRKFKRNKVVVFGLNSQWQADLADVSSLKRWNKKNTFLLTCIDVFSKQAWVVPLKDKKGATLVNAFKKIFKSAPRPLALQTDKGTAEVSTL